MSLEIYRNLDFFKPREFNAPEEMSADLLMRLDDARRYASTPFTVSHVRQYRPGDFGEHGEGTGVDVRCHFSADRYRIVLGALGLSPHLHAPIFNRIGIYDRHIHLGISTTRPQNVIWTGKSQ